MDKYTQIIQCSRKSIPRDIKVIHCTMTNHARLNSVGATSAVTVTDVLKDFNFIDTQQQRNRNPSETRV